MNAAALPQRKNHLDSLAVGLLLTCCIFWGGQQVLIKATLGELPPVFQAWLRLGGATLLVWLWCRFKGIALLARDGTLKAGLLAGGLFAAEFACIYIGLQHTGASRLTVFLYTSPFWVALLVPLAVRTERLRGLQWLGLAIAFGAMAFALREGLVNDGRATLLGDLLGLSARAYGLWAGAAIHETALARVAPAKQLFYQVGVSAAVLPLLSLLLGERWSLDWSAFAWTSLVLQALVGAFASYLAWMWMLARYPATKMSSFVFLTPVFALLFGAGWLGEPITAGLVAALGLVAVGIVLVNRKPAAA